MNTVERAYDLARSGRFSTVAEIRKELQAEGCSQVSQHLAGRLLQRELRELLLQAQQPHS